MAEPYKVVYHGIQGNRNGKSIANRRTDFRGKAMAGLVDADGYATTVEIRKYPAIKRSISVNGRLYFLQFPPMYFARIGGQAGSRFYAAFYANGKLYKIPLGGCVGDFSVCLNQVEHYVFGPNTSFEKMLQIFWSTDFRLSDGYLANGNIFGGSFHKWAKLSLEQVLEDVQKKKYDDGYGGIVKNGVTEATFVNYILKLAHELAL